MKKDVENKLKSILPINEDMDNFFKIIDLPDEKFDQIYPQMRDVFTQTFKSSEFQADVIRNAKVYSQLNDIDIEAEKSAVEELIQDIKNDDTLNSNKKDLLVNIIESSALATYELFEVPRERIEVKIQKINDNAKIPEYAHPTDAGADIFASETVTFEAGETKIVPTGIKVDIPTGYAIFIYPRSGMSLKTGMRIANSVGVIDSDYNKEIGVIMTNTFNSKWTIMQGDKIAQMIIMSVPMIKFIEVNDIQDSGRGGFGSTGN